MMRTISVIAPIIESPANNITTEKEQANLDAIDLGPEFALAARFLDRGPSSVENQIDEALAIPDLLVKALEAQKEGSAGIVVNCMSDPGVKVLKAALEIPVIGAAETAFHFAATLGHRFGLLDIGADTGPMVNSQVAALGLTEKFAGVRGTDVAVVEIRADLQLSIAKLIKSGIDAVTTDAADVLVLGCTGFTGMADKVRQGLLSKGLDVPVIDPLPLTIRTLAALIISGQIQSKRAYPTPREKKQLRGYDLAELYEVIN